ncbi:MAG: hypothetical protein CBE00_02190 [Planctomycetaceae bacterium TMED240]|nr:hypothetical protein [Rhodopirellula sp.]OUX08332.1 MAG: hypothetical protein CBE00_02190 [Planctomycetaceae bacterium TMED240]
MGHFPVAGSCVAVVAVVAEVAEVAWWEGNRSACSFQIQTQHCARLLAVGSGISNPQRPIADRLEHIVAHANSDRKFIAFNHRSGQPSRKEMLVSI